jgi:hypothetical protein
MGSPRDAERPTPVSIRAAAAELELKKARLVSDIRIPPATGLMVLLHAPAMVQHN